MKSRTAYNTLSLASLLVLSNAWPLFPPPIERREPVSYSVVAVGGGSTADGASPTATITDAATRTTTVMETQLSTIVIAGPETPTTIVVTVTSPSPVTITDYSPASTITQITSPTPTSSFPPSQQYPSDSSPSIAPSIAIITATETLSPVTVTVTQPLPSTRPYDDGMWHTYYYYTVTPESSSSWTTTAIATTWESSSPISWTPSLSTTSSPTTSLETQATSSTPFIPFWDGRLPFPTPL